MIEKTNHIGHDDAAAPIVDAGGSGIAEAFALTEIPALARRLGRNLTYRQAYFAVLDGKLPATKIDGRWCVSGTALQAFLAARR
jgi:hypothetical protein